MKKTVCELFAGVGGFRCGLNGIKTLEDIEDIKNEKKKEKWETMWFSQWEPAEKNTQYAHDCYVYHFGSCPDKNGEDTTNCNIEEVDKKALPDFNLLVGGFPCQDYSVASSLATSKGLEGKKGVLWWSIRETIEVKKPSFVLLENVDRLIKSPAKQRGRDFGIILKCFQEEGYTVEWRVINAADYGLQQRRRRIFIFAYKNDTRYNDEIQKNVGYSKENKPEKKKMSMRKLLLDSGFFAETFAVQKVDEDKMVTQMLSKNLGKISASFTCPFENTGVMKDGVIYTLKTLPKYSGTQKTLGDILETGSVDKQYFIPEEKLYYTDPAETHSDETSNELSKAERQTWQYLKGAKKILRKSASGHEYIFSEGAIPMIDSYDKPARTMLTSEGSFSRTTHIVEDRRTGAIRLLTAQETERIQGFPTDHTKKCLVGGQVVEMPLNKRRFMMGNALVVDLVREMEVTLSKIFENEDKERNEIKQTTDIKDVCGKNHIYDKEDLIDRFDACLGKTFEEIDDQNIFSKVQKFKFQKGIAGVVVEQCILGYPPNSKQEADLIVFDGKDELKTELKVTGMIIEKEPLEHFTAKEPMSITAVGIYDIVDEDFWTSHFWEKLEHMLIVYYYYASERTVSAYEYRLFKIKGYEFHEFTEDEIEVLKRDWEYVRDLCKQVITAHPEPKNEEWKTAVKQDYINVHGQLKRVLSYINLAPKFPPRFRLKRPVVSNIISKHFGYELEQLPGKYIEIADIDKKCREITQRYSGHTVEQLSAIFNISFMTEKGLPKKGISEEIVVAMFGGKSKKINRVEIFQKFGLIAKTIVLTSKGGRTEDMKLFRIDFDEITRTEIVDDDGGKRTYSFEDSEMYSYFADHEFLCIIFEEPETDSIIHTDLNSHSANRFIGFKRLVFDDIFIDTTVKRLWEDIRYKVMQNKLENVNRIRKDGTVMEKENGEISLAPNFLKGSQNEVFVRGSGKNSAMIHKTECVNGIQMLPQYVWIKGLAVVEQLNTTPMI